MKVEKKAESRPVIKEVLVPVDTFVLTLEKDEAEVVRAVLGALSLDSKGPVRTVTDKLYDQLTRAGVQGVLSDPAVTFGYAGVSLHVKSSDNNPIVKYSIY